MSSGKKGPQGFLFAPNELSVKYKGQLSRAINTASSAVETRTEGLAARMPSTLDPKCFRRTTQFLLSLYITKITNQLIYDHENWYQREIFPNITQNCSYLSCNYSDLPPPSVPGAPLEKKKKKNNDLNTGAFPMLSLLWNLKSKKKKKIKHSCNHLFWSTWAVAFLTRYLGFKAA